MPSYSRKNTNFMQEAQQELRFWMISLKTQALAPNKYYAQRQPKLDNKRTLTRALSWSALPFLIFAASLGIIEKRYLLMPLYFLLAYAGCALWAYVQSFVLDKLFDKKFSFRQCFDLVLTTAPALVVAWIPTAGIVVSSIIACFWNYKGLINQFKVDQGIGLAAATLPIVIAGAATISLGYFGVMFLYFSGQK